MYNIGYIHLCIDVAPISCICSPNEALVKVCMQIKINVPFEYVCMDVFINLHFGEHACKDTGTKV